MKHTLSVRLESVQSTPGTRRSARYFASADCFWYACTTSSRLS